MAQRVLVQLVDDMDGTDFTPEDGAQGFPFAFDGVTYEIDLNGKNLDAFRKVMEPYMTAATRTGGRAGKRSSHLTAVPGGRVVGKPDPEQTKAIREWARKNGWPNMGDRGRIPGEIMTAYNSGTPKTTPDAAPKAATPEFTDGDKPAGKTAAATRKPATRKPAGAKAATRTSTKRVSAPVK